MKLEQTQNYDPFRLDLARFSLPEAEISDRGVKQIHSALAGHKVLLTVTGGIAAYKAPGLVRMLRSYGAEVDVRLTEKATEFIGYQSLKWAAENGQISKGSALTGDVEHLNPYSLYLVAPATYDFINGMASGRADTPALTTMATALGRVEKGEARMLVLPCMNGDMNNRILRDSLSRLASSGVGIVMPRIANGKLEFPGSEVVTVAAARHLSASRLRNASVLLTGGPTPVPLDDVRVVTNIFKGKLGLQVANELIIRGANPKFLLGGSLEVPDYVKPFTERYQSFDQYRDKVLLHAQSANPAFAVLSSAVADYRPKTVHAGKIASKSKELSLPPFVPTEKVVELLHDRFPALPIVSFKLLSRVSVDTLLEEAKSRLQRHSEMVVANRLEDCSADHQRVYLVTKGGVTAVEGSKRDVARGIVTSMESLFAERMKSNGLATVGGAAYV